MMKEKEKIYTLKCDYYKRSFDSVMELIRDIEVSGMDPAYEILKDGRPTGEYAAEYLSY